MKTDQTKLANGTQIVTANLPSSYSATISIFVRVGGRYEDFQVNGGVSHFLEHLLFKGTPKRPSTKIISEQIDAVGGWNNAYTSSELTCYYVKAPYQHVQLGLDILVDMVRNALLDPEELDRERSVILEEMHMYKDEPGRYIHRLSPAMLWPGSALANEVLGSEEVIKEISRNAVADYMKKYYQAGNLVVAAAGKVDHEKFAAQVEKLMGDMPDSSPMQPEPVGTPLQGEIAATLTKDTAQAHLAISTVAYPYRHPNDPAAKIITTILGGGLSSRLFLNVRERKGLAYSVSAGAENYVDSGEFEVYAGVNLDKQADAITAIMEELDRITREPVGDEELEKGKNQIRGALQMAMESNSAVADRLGTQQTLLGTIRSVEETLADIDAVTTEEVTRVAVEMLAPERLRLGLISPEPEAAQQRFEELIRRK